MNIDERISVEIEPMTKDDVRALQFLKACAAVAMSLAAALSIPTQPKHTWTGVILFGAFTVLIIYRILRTRRKYKKDPPVERRIYPAENCPQRGVQFGSNTRTMNRSLGASFLFGSSQGDNINSCKDCKSTWNFGSRLDIPLHP